MKATERLLNTEINIDTDVIIPARYLNTTDHKELASHCMEDIDKDFTKKVNNGGYNCSKKEFLVVVHLENMHR